MNAWLYTTNPSKRVSEREREREREESWGVVVRDTTVWRGVVTET
jgi:hypothetical protein